MTPASPPRLRRPIPPTAHLHTHKGCGFAAWPTFGFEAFKWTFFFDSNQQYVGSGMICPHVVNWSMMLGAILSWCARG